jgi:predicted nucleotidyltransferase
VTIFITFCAFFVVKDVTLRKKCYLCDVEYHFNKKDMRRTEIVERIRQEAQKLSPHAQTILYGSEARGDARPDSDIDLLVLVDKDKLTYSDKDRIIAPFYDIELDTGIIISMIIMPRKEWENRPFLTPFQDNVNKEGITL